MHSPKKDAQVYRDLWGEGIDLQIKDSLKNFDFSTTLTIFCPSDKYKKGLL